MRLGTVLVAASVLAGAAGGAGAAAAQDYRTAVVEVHEVGTFATVGGTVIPHTEVTLSAQIPGQVTFLAGGEGDDFKEGAELVAIDDDDIQAQRRAALAQIYNAETSLRNAQVQYGRELFSPRTNSPTTFPGMGAPGMFDQMFTRPFSNMMGRSDTGYERHADLYAQGSQISQAQGTLAQARAQLDTLDAKLRDARLVAPFDGVIIDKLVEEGDTVQPGMPLLRFARVKYLRIQAEVPLRLVSSLRKGMQVPARLDVHGDEIPVRVYRVYPMADASRHTVTVKFDLPKFIHGRPGMYAEVKVPDLTVSVRSQPLVPAAALVPRGSLPGVFVKTEDGVSLRLIRVGDWYDRDRRVVLSGLQGGERVILDPPPGLTSGADAASRHQDDDEKKN